MAEEIQIISLVEVKNILKKVEKERNDLLYEQRIALDHAQRFTKLTVSKNKELIKELIEKLKLEENHAYKIAEILPTTIDDIKTLFAKERMNITEDDMNKIIKTVEKYYIE